MIVAYNPFGTPIEDYNEELANERIGERIRDIRESYSITQAELGSMIGLNANRIQQYESGVRKPKLDLIKKIAHALRVEPIALLNPILTSDIGAMYGFFELERSHNLRLEKINGQVYIAFGESFYSMDSHSLNSYLEEWYNRQIERDEAIEKASSDDEKKKIYHEYNVWEWEFPRALVDKTSKSAKKMRLKQRIAEMQKELEELENES